MGGAKAGRTTYDANSKNYRTKKERNKALYKFVSQPQAIALMGYSMQDYQFLNSCARGGYAKGSTAPVPGCKGKKKDCTMTCASIRNYNKVAEMAIFKLPKTVLANMKKDMKFSDA